MCTYQTASRTFTPFLLWWSAFLEPTTIIAQSPPCPPMLELATVVDTPAKCACFYALVSSGLDQTNPETYGNAFDDETKEYVPQTGSFYGVDGIADYLNSVNGEIFVKEYSLVGTQMILDMTGSTMEQCVMTNAERRQTKLNSDFTNGVEYCMHSVIGKTLEYTMTGVPDSPILVQRIIVYIPDEIFSTANEALNTDASAEYVCDTILNTCGKSGETKSKAVKSSKAKKSLQSSKVKKWKVLKDFKKNKHSRRMQKCLEQFGELPASTDANGITYVDGNSKSCRILHSSFVALNDRHCPHVTFEPEVDMNGFVKCNESAYMLPTDIFSQETLDKFHYAGSLLGLGETGFKLQEGGGCPD